MVLNIRYDYINEQQQYSEHYTRISAQPSKPHHEINADNFKSHNILPEYRDFGFEIADSSVKGTRMRKKLNKCADVYSSGFRLNECFISSGYALTFSLWIENMIIENKFIGFGNNVYDDSLVDLECR